ncbi:MAG: 50S ribosomal protein L6 [Phycisphaerales bacterium]
MSRIGKKPIPIPSGVKVNIRPGAVEVEGPKGKLSLKVRDEIKVVWDQGEKAVKVSLADGVSPDLRQAKASWGATRAHIRNMVEGVTKGYEKSMQVVGTGWSATVSGKTLKIVAGLANPIILNIPEGVTVVVDKPTGEVTPVKVSGSDRGKVGMFASSMRQKRKPEPYNGKGIKYAEEVIKRKQGKQFGA